MLHAGIGPTHVNGFLACLGIPGIHQKTIKRMERIIGPIVEKKARESCDRACALEKSLTESASITADNPPPDDLLADDFCADDLLPNDLLVEADIVASTDDEISFDEAMAIIEYEGIWEISFIIIITVVVVVVDADDGIVIVVGDDDDFTKNCESLLV